MNKWKEIWSRPISAPATFQLDDLIKADGFNSGAGKVEPASWVEYVKYVQEISGLRKEDSIFEVGCGAGAFLYTLYEHGHAVGGCDYSEQLVGIARQVMPNMDLQVAEARSLPVAPEYDIVLSNSVFQYFGDFAYAAEVVRRMRTKSRRAIVLLDINDEEHREEALRIRKQSLPPGEYEKKYAGLDHLFYPKSFFERIGEELGCKVAFYRQNIEGYGNNHFRYNVVMTE